MCLAQCCVAGEGKPAGHNEPVARREGGDMAGALAPSKPLTARDVCDRCGAQAYVRVVLPGSGELLFCAHHGRQHAEALAKVAVEIQDETERLSPSAGGRREGWPARRVSGERPPELQRGSE